MIKKVLQVKHFGKCLKKGKAVHMRAQCLNAWCWEVREIKKLLNRGDGRKDVLSISAGLIG